MLLFLRVCAVPRHAKISISLNKNTGMWILKDITTEIIIIIKIDLF